MFPQEIKVKKTTKKTTLIIPAGLVLASPVRLPVGEENLEVVYGAGAKVNLFWLDKAGQDFNGQLKIVLSGAGAVGNLAGLVVGSKIQHWQLSLEIVAQAKKTFFQTVWRGLAAGESRLNWQGRVKVEKAAGASSAFLRGDFLLLSKNATVTARPTLEIGQPKITNANHAVTVASLDDNQLNYLLSRGLNKPAAQKILTASFVSGLPDFFHQSAARAAFREVVIN